MKRGEVRCNGIHAEKGGPTTRLVYISRRKRKEDGKKHQHTIGRDRRGGYGPCHGQKEYWGEIPKVLTENESVGEKKEGK